MVWAFLAFLLFSGGSPALLLGSFASTYLKPQVKAHVADPGRREEALRALKAGQAQLDVLNRRHVEDMKRFQATVRDYRSKPEDFDRLFEERSAAYRADLDQIWKHREAMLRHIRPEEWQAIIGAARAEAAQKNP